jgi:hypothetical protein
MDSAQPLARHSWNTTPSDDGKRIAARVCVTCGHAETWNAMRGMFTVVSTPIKSCVPKSRKGLRLGSGPKGAA